MNGIQTDLRALKIVYGALIAGVTFFLGVTMYLHTMSGPFLTDQQMYVIMLGIANALAFSTIPVGFFLFKKRIENIDSISGTREKLARFREAMILRAATMEGPAFFFVVCFMLFGNFVFAGEAVLVLILMAYFFPTNEKIAAEIHIDAGELNQ